MRYLKRIVFFTLILSFFMFIKLDIVSADYEARIRSNGTCSLKTTSTGICFYSSTNYTGTVSGTYWLDTGDFITVVTSFTPVKAPTSGNGSECKSTFSKIILHYNGVDYPGYACTDNIWDTSNVTAEQAAEFSAAGFPESYWASLALLKTEHPTWSFVAIDTELDFQTAVNNMDSGNKSLIQGNAGYLSTTSGNYNWETDKFKVYDGANSGSFVTHNSSYWFAANNQAIAYYLDPRNFLADMYIFQFETIEYDKENYSLDKELTINAIKKLLGTAYISNFAEYFYQGGDVNSVNPIYLASLSKQEVGSGTTASTAINGKSFTYEGKTYSGLYNFYNIGATSGTNAVLRGLVYANGTKDGTVTTYGRPWTSIEKAIVGGANFIKERYVKPGQFTSYFKKFNTVYNYAKKNGYSPNANYSNQYMQNIKAPSSEANSTFKSYSTLNLMDHSFVFYIPVYKNMPAKTSLPAQGNPNNRLSSININGAKISDYASDKYSYTLHVDNEITSAVIAATKINSNATLTGVGTKNLEVGENKYTLTVTAQNGSKQEYSVNIIRAEDTSGIVYPTVEEIMTGASITNDGTYVSNLTLTTKVSDFTNQILAESSTAKVTVKTGATSKTSGYLYTGDTITITSGVDTKTYTVVIYGDVNGDGLINALDLLRVQKHLLKTSSLTEAALKSADVNKDSSVNALDLLRVQKHILGDPLISQK